MKERYSWSNLLANPTLEEFDKSNSKDPFFDDAISNINDFRMEGLDPVSLYTRKAPYLFSIIN